MTPHIRMVSVPVASIEEVRDLLMERLHGSPARSPAHNARLCVEAMLTAAPVLEEGGAVRYRHKKRGTEYTLIGVGRAQGELQDDDPVVLYRGDDGGLWVRHQVEFCDGRFEEIPALATREEAPACKKCGGKGYVEYEGGEGEGYPSRPETEACGCREEPPAEAGGWRDMKEEIEEVSAALMTDGSAIAYFEAQRRMAAFKAMRGVEADQRAVNYIDAALSALRAQPQAREEAQPVWGYAYRQAEFGGVTITPKPGWQLWPMTTDVDRRCIEDMRSQGSRYDLQPLYTHPAPDVLRVAVEALEKIKLQRDVGLGTQSIAVEALQALAALQAEQGEK